MERDIKKLLFKQNTGWVFYSNFGDVSPDQNVMFSFFSHIFFLLVDPYKNRYCVNVML